MKVRTGHSGRALPFEHDRRLVLKRLPADAVVTSATITVTPVSQDGEGRFVETLAFQGAAGAWGASARPVPPDGLEIDLRARRKVQALSGTALDGTLLVDFGGGFVAVNAQGGFGGTSQFTLADPNHTDRWPLPALTVTALRVAGLAGTPNLSALHVASPPSNVTIAVVGGPVIFSQTGDLVAPVTTPDFAAVLQPLLLDLPLTNGVREVPIVIHSDTIARLDLILDLEFVLETAIVPDGVRSVAATYRYDGRPVEGGGRLTVNVPPGLSAVPGGSSGRVQGAFEATKVVAGVLTPSGPSEPIPVLPTRPLAQPFTLSVTDVVSGVDVQLAAVTATVALNLDLVEDLDGKPGRLSLLPKPAEIELDRHTAGDLTWVSVPLPAELELTGGRRSWLVLQTREGSAVWAADPEPAVPAAASQPAGPQPPSLQQSLDGGLSWRAVPSSVGGGPTAGRLRLRQVTREFSLPLELRVATGGIEQPRSLQRFASQGAIDIGLDLPELADAVNVTLADAGAVPPATVEHVGNGDFERWSRVGSRVTAGAGVSVEDMSLPPDLRLGRGVDVSPDGGTAYFVGHRDSESLLLPVMLTVDVLSGAARVSPLETGVPTAVLLGPDGRQALIAIERSLVDDALRESGEGAGAPPVPDGGDADRGDGEDDGRGGDAPEEARAAGFHRQDLVVVDTATGSLLGRPVSAAERLLDLAAGPDRQVVHLLGRRPAVSEPLAAGAVATAEPFTIVRAVGWADLLAAAGLDPQGNPLPGTPPELDWEEQIKVALPGPPRAFAVTPGGSLGVLSAPAAERRLTVFVDAAALAEGAFRTVTVDAGAVDLACDPARGQLHVLGAGLVQVVSLDPPRVVSSVSLGAAPTADRIAIDASGQLALISQDGPVLVLDVARRILLKPGPDLHPANGTWSGTGLAISPDGAHAAVALRDRPDARLLAISTTPPEDWQLLAGEVRPVRLPATGQAMARLGRPVGPASGPALPAGPTALAQVVPIRPGTRYRFGFDGFADAEGATGQLVWRDATGATLRTDRLPVTFFDTQAHFSLQTVPQHELVAVAPSSAAQVDVRFLVPDGAAAVGRVSLLETTNALAAEGWAASTPTVTQRATAVGLSVSNPGAQPATVGQVISARPGHALELRVVGRAVDVRLDGVAGAVVARFADESSVPVGSPLRIDLDPLDLDERAASVTVPAGTAELDLQVEVPAGTGLQFDVLSVALTEPRTLDVHLVSEAPGALTIVSPAIRLDVQSPQPAPVPPGGVWPPLPTAGPENDDCYCGACGLSRPAGAGVPTVTPAGRPAQLLACPACGTTRVRLGGRLPVGPAPAPLPGFRVPARLGQGGPAVVSRLRLDVPLSALPGVGPARAADLARIGLPDLPRLAAADVATVSGLTGISESMALELIHEARRQVRERAVRVVFDE